jgi:hypothetical protein
MLTLMCANMSVVSTMGLKSNIERGIVMAVIRNDAPNAERTNIFLLRESPTFFKRCRGAATRETSATMSAVKVEDHSSQGEARGTD